MNPRWPRRGLYAITPDEPDTGRLLARVETVLRAGAAWLQRMTTTYPAAVWLNPTPEKYWGHSHSTVMLKQLMHGRMYPLTLDGLDDAMRELSRKR